MIRTVHDKLRKIAHDMAEEKGAPFRLFGLFRPVDWDGTLGGKWDLVASAPWADSSLIQAIAPLSRKVRGAPTGERDTTFDFVDQIVYLDADHPLVKHVRQNGPASVGPEGKKLDQGDFVTLGFPAIDQAWLIALEPDHEYWNQLVSP